MRIETIDDIEDANNNLLTIESGFSLSGGFGRYQLLRSIKSGYILCGTLIFIFSIPFYERLSFTCTGDGYENECCGISKACNSKLDIKHEYISENLISEFDLLCHSTIVGWIGTGYFIGYMFAQYIYGQLSDIIGRSYTITICMIVAILGSIIFISATPPHGIWLIIFGTVISGLATGYNGPAYNIAFDALNASHINACLAAFNCIAALMQVIIALFMYIPHGWRAQIIAIIIFYATAGILAFSISEGPRYLISKSRYKDTMKAFRKIAKYNRIPESKFPPKDTKLLIEYEAEMNIMRSSTGSNQAPNKQYTIIDALKYKSTRYLFLLLIPQFITTFLVYFGISLDMARLEGDIIVNTIMAGVFEIPAYVLVIFLVRTETLGRKYTMFIFYIFSIIGSLFYILVGGDVQWINILLLIVRKFGISGCADICQLFATELFPSVVRSAVLGTLTFIGVLGAIIAPMIVQLLHQPHYIFIAASLLAMASLFFIPETRGKVVLDIFQEDMEKEENNNHGGDTLLIPDSS